MERTGRKPRVHEPNTIHHVMMRGNNKQNIFFGEGYFNYFLDLLKSSADKFDHKILAYCLMSNHVHLIAHIKESPLSKVMQNINYRYARWANYHMKRVGHLFQARYRSIDVRNESYLINLCRYIHFNPVAAKMVDDPAAYRWSSHCYYLSASGPAWMDFLKVNRAIIDKTGLAYAEFMRQEPNRDNWKPGLYFSKEGKLMTDDSILRDLQESSTGVLAPDKEFLPRHVVVGIVCHHLEVKPSELFGLSRNRALSKKRALLMHYLLKYCDINIAQLEKLFNRTAPGLGRQVYKISLTKTKDFPEAILLKIDRALGAGLELRR